MKLNKAIEKFMEYKKVKEISKNTKKMYRFYLEKFLDDVGDKSLNEVKLDEILDFMKGKSTLTKKFIATLLKNFFKFFGYLELADKIPYPRGTGKEIRPLEKEEVEIILTKCKSKRDKAIILLMVSSGLRASEVINLRIKDLDFDKRIGRVWSKGKKKEEKPDFFVFSKKAKRMILNYLGDRVKEKEDYIFLDDKGKKFKYWSFWYLFKKKFGIRPHQLRHTFCYLYARKLLPTELKVLARHKTFETTKRYINPEFDKILERYKEIEDI